MSTGLSPRELRSAFSDFTTGVTIVTSRDEGGSAQGITVNSFTSVSLQPPLILYCLGKSAFRYPVFSSAPVFAVNILSREQHALSERYAREVPDSCDDLALTEWSTGSPVLVDALAAFDCVQDAVHDAGDHVIIVGRVEEFRRMRADNPLVYFRSSYRDLARDR